MNIKQRKEWDAAIEMVYKIGDPDGCTLELLKAANAYILKLERELQNIKGHKRIAAVLKPKVGTRMKVYVVTTGQATYEDQVKVIGVCRTFTDGVNLGMKESIICKDDAKWGDYWYDVEEWEVE